jgi:hypothetical protein
MRGRTWRLVKEDKG